jgi:CheY-like chemotaxis protein
MANLLIVDDEEALAAALQRLFTMKGHTVRAVTSGQAALDAIQDDLPDLIIADVKMPGMTGLQLREGVRAKPEWEDIPFLFISASVLPEMEGQIAALDNVSYLRKPFDIEEVFESVNECLENANGAQSQ